MPIVFHCEHCGKKVSAPDETGGRRGKCPRCSQYIFIPAPPDQVEEIPLVQTDPNEERRRRAMKEEELRLQRELAEHRDAPETLADSTPRPEDTGLPFPGFEVPLKELVPQYLLHLARGELELAEELETRIVAQGKDAQKAVEQLAMQEFIHPQLASIPPTVISGFFKKLLARFPK
jgi:DNA-directed RNA polymerase subunit RPC12/RpoP